MTYNPYAHLPGGFSQNDGTIDFYARINDIVTSESVVLDLGAGRAGWFEDDDIPYRVQIRLLKGKAKTVIAMDVDPVVLENQSADKCVVMTGDTIPMKDGSVDIVIADYVLEHIDDPAAFHQEIDRVLKPGGWFCARTPHKYSYVSIMARCVKNSKHANVLKRVQPGRKDVDVFPTRYRLNTRKDISAAFPGYTDKTFIYRADPAYFFGRKWIYKCFAAMHRLTPSLFSGNVFVFLQK